MDLLTGESGRKQQQLVADQMGQQSEQFQASQRQSLAQVAAEQGELDQAAARGGRRGRGRGLLTFLSGSGQASLG